MRPEAERAARVALALAGVDVATQRFVMAELPRHLDRAGAMARRDAAICAAHRIVGSPRKLAKELLDFYTRAWPQHRHMIEPPAGDTPLRRAFFLACQGAEDAGTCIPGERQIRNIVNP